MRPATPLLLTCALLAGCAPPRPSFPALHPLAGTVTGPDGPVKGGGLIFLREAGDPTGLVVNAHVADDGTFTGTTSRTSARGADIRPGVPVGRFVATYHPLSDGSRMNLETKVPGVFEFVAGPNRLDIVLTGPRPTGTGQPRDDADPAPVAPTPPATPKTTR